MDISSLCEAIYEDLDASLTAMQWSEAALLVLTLKCNDWTGLDRRRQFEIRCVDPIEVNCSLGPIEEVSYYTEHPLLLKHSDLHSQLFFSSAPDSPAEVYLAVHAAANSVLHGWRAPQELLCDGPDTFSAALASGNGLLAEGPYTVIEAIQRGVGSIVRVNVLTSSSRNTTLVVITFGTDYIICGAVEVTELVS